MKTKNYRAYFKTKSSRYHVDFAIESEIFGNDILEDSARARIQKEFPEATVGGYEFEFPIEEI